MLYSASDYLKKIEKQTAVNLDDYKFEIDERPVYIPESNDWNAGGTGLLDTDEQCINHDWQSIVRADTNERIAIYNTSTYKPVTNAQVIESALKEIDDLGIDYIVDPGHSFVTNERMRLQLTFPEFVVSDEGTAMDGASQTALSLYIHNSYNKAEGVRLLWGYIRYVCSNGMILGEMLGSFYRRHTSDFSLNGLSESVGESIKSLDEVQEWIDDLQTKSAGKDQFPNHKIEKILGKRLAPEAQKYNLEQFSAWTLLNIITHIVSHQIPQRLRREKQLQVSKLFNA